MFMFNRHDNMNTDLNDRDLIYENQDFCLKDDLKFYFVINFDVKNGSVSIITVKCLPHCVYYGKLDI